MDNREVRRRVERYACLVAREFPGCEVILFGSRVRGEAHQDSDIDVAVVVPEIEGDFLTLAARLCHLRNDIDPMIEPHLLSRRNDESGLLREVLRTGEVISPTVADGKLREDMSECAREMHDEIMQLQEDFLPLEEEVHRSI